MNFNCTKKLQELHAQYIRDMQEGKLTRAYVTSACEYGFHMACGASGGWQYQHYHKALTDAMNNKLACNLGAQCGISKSGRPLTVGVCAEQHAANDLLKLVSPDENISFDIEEIVFSPAIRLKGKQMKEGPMEPCTNCDTLFTK